MHPIDDTAELNLWDYISVVRRRWPAIVVGLVVVPLAAIGLARYQEAQAEPVYEAVHRLAINPERGVSNFTLEQAAVLVNDGQAGRDARADLEGHPGYRVRAEADLDVGAVEVTARGSEPDRTRTIANAYAQQLLEFYAADDLNTRLEETAALRAAIDTAQSALDTATFSANAEPEVARLQLELEDAAARYQTALDALRIEEQRGIPPLPLRSLSDASVREADATGFASVELSRQLVLTLVVGGMLGVGLAFLWETLDRRVATPEAAADAFGVPLLTEVPDGGKGFAGSGCLAPPPSAVNEAYRRLRTILRLERVADHDGATVVVVTSPGPAEGKTTTVAHLARALGEVGASVLAVSADFRKPQLHLYFGVDPSGGIASLRDDDAPRGDIIQGTDLPGVSIVTAGGGTADPIELIDRSRRFIASALPYYDFVIVDTPPLLSANDAVEFVDDADHYVVVASASRTNRPAANKARDVLLRTGSPLLGVVLTGVKDLGRYGYYDGYYGPPEGERVAEPAEVV